jgi:hypothetical protein
MCGQIWRIAAKLFDRFRPGQASAPADPVKDRAAIRRALSGRISPHLLKDVGGDES